ncbi:Gfo/Idh/MocA family protein [Frigoribacterium sp. 2-23]|uniref:Gfo/Idh/MocA family protein n=1 Tax=Frigoribacterium sp. 2-23 TaxID=3415006 RepID=UPI003C6F7483
MTSRSTPALRVALIGTAFMGRAHSHAWRTAPRFFDLPLRPETTLLVGRDPDRTRDAADTLGWAEWATDWREAVARDDIDLIDICVPGDVHAEIAIAALEAGKNVLCEKPLARTVEEAARMTAAAEAASARGVVALCGFSYRRTPALALARRFVSEGRLGTIRHIRAQYLQDWLSSEDAPYTWRLDRETAGSGALGDIGAHSIDLAQWVSGHEITAVSAQLRTFVGDRPVPDPRRAGDQQSLGGTAAADAPRRPVTVDDAAAFTATFDGGALGVFESTRMALGHRNANRLEVNGDLGSIAFDFERMNELEYYDGRETRAVGAESDGAVSAGAVDDQAQGFRRIQVTDPGHPYVDAWWPTGHGLGYEHVFTHQVVDLVRAIADGTQPRPSFSDALAVQKVLDAVERSAADRSVLTPVEGSPASTGSAVRTASTDRTLL